MAKKKLPQPSPGELDLLQILWLRGPSTVKEVHEEVSERHQSTKSLTTTLKLMQIMEQKGLIAREGESRPQRFTAVLAQDHTEQALVKDFMRRTFQGNAARLVLCALEEGEVSNDEIREIRALLKKYRGGARDE